MKLHSITINKTLRCLLVTVYSMFICSVSIAQTITRAEYFIDTDPGQGSATTLTVAAPSNAINFNFNVPTTSLPVGFHLLGFRIRSSENTWSHAQLKPFYIVPASAFSNAVNVTQGEYFLDADPGKGNGTSFSVTAAPAASLALPISTSSLTPGFHTISFRLRDNLSKWSHSQAQTFYIVPPASFNEATVLIGAEYFIDTDPGVGKGIVLPITSGNPQNNTFAVPLTNVNPGFHKIGFRYRDNNKKWSMADVRTFYVVNTSTLTAAQIVRAEYFVDTDPGIGQGTIIPGIVPGTTIDQLVALDMTGVSTGAHTLNIRIKDDKGFWSYHATANFTVSACVPPASPLAPSVSRCNEGTVTLTATGATGLQEFRWYDDAILNNLIFTGPAFTTPVLSVSTNYYVSIYDPATSCESSRTLVSANVTIIPKPIVNPSGIINFCEGSSFFLSATSGFSNYIWSNGQTTQQILVTAGGDYTVQVGNGVCLSEVSDPVNVNVTPSPAKPVITVTGNTTICGTGSVDLTGPDGVEYIWSTGAVTQTITVSQTGVYYLLTKSAGNCPSIPSDPVVVTILTPPCGVIVTNQPPVINSTPLASQIEGRVHVDLTTLISDPDNNIDFSTLQLTSNTTAKNAPAYIDAAYNLVIEYSGIPFTGTDRITLEVCDLASACIQQVIDIDVVGDIEVFNGVTPNGDGFNDFLLIKYIDSIEGASQNKVTIFNRWGDVVFEVTEYNNSDRAFFGLNQKGNELPSGTYFYKIEIADRSKPVTGYLTLLR